ncbi:hypothetical protein ACIGD1_31975 [Streptomyces sp. NPDC085612]|uniref:hypothetical protein n=1 Tax=Streptomyces sp. NPDC085612 TaxID=3365732 RepID=UPI0037D54B0A
MPDLPAAFTALHDEPFPELLGLATQAVTSADGRWTAVSSVTSGSSRIAVYRSDDLSCVQLATFAAETDSIAFHPALPLLAVALDNGDGYCRKGGITLLEPDTGHRVDFPDPAWGVEAVRWQDERTLRATFIAMDDGTWHRTARATVVREDWRGLAPDAVDLSSLDREPHDGTAAPDDDPPPALPLLRALAARAGRTYGPHGGVRAVAALPDGRVLATRSHVAVECRSADGALLWSVPAPSAAGGVRIAPAADGRTVRVAVPGPDSRTRTDVLLVDTADGTVTERLTVPFSAALATRTDGVWALRDTHDRCFGAEPPTAPDTRIHSGTTLTGSVHVGDRYELIPLDVRRCPELLHLRGRRQIVALAPDGAETVLCAADPAPPARSVYVCDDRGPALLHGGTELRRRDLASGSILWTCPTGSPVIDLDAEAGVVHALCADGTLLRADAADGRLLARHRLPPYGPLSLYAAPGGTVLVGTAAGQILRCPAAGADTP